MTTQSIDLKLVKHQLSIFLPDGQEQPHAVLLGGGKIAGLLTKAEADLAERLGAEIIDAHKCLIIPGLVDIHVHLIGGGGEAGPASRTPESQLSAFLDAGITTVVGVLGTDCITRRQETLIAKCRALNEDGITAFNWAGSYRVPVATATGSIQSDLCLIASCVGVGEIAVSDHRSSAPTPHELARIASEARVGGMLSGKAGLVHIHMGTAKPGVQPLLDAVAQSDVPVSQFLPTHMERHMPDGAASATQRWLEQGGNMDFTAPEATGPIRALRGIGGAVLKQCSISSDSFGSLPVFNSRGELWKYEVGDPKELLRCMRKLLIGMEAKEGQGRGCPLPLNDVIPLFTSNPAQRLKLSNKGIIDVGMDADLVFLEPDTLELHSVIARGELVRTPEWVRGGAFERGPRIRPRVFADT